MNQAPAPLQPMVPKLNMVGGAKYHLLDFATKFSEQVNFFVLIFLVLTIVFVKQIPLQLRKWSGTLFGRTFLFILTILVAKYYSWRNGLLVAILTLLLLSLSPRTLAEGFHANTPIDKKHKWFVESTLGENPEEIDETEVLTYPVQ
jgi:hypothetical protein|uniref:Uncharacterized protein n=1 Tax=viral metagenome TaxID=1070528 RepID=A0A6C0DBE3_9ZZZZ